MSTPSFGLWLLLGIVFAPFYLIVAGWFLSRPRGIRLPLIGMGYLVGLTAVAWGGMALFAFVLQIVFF